MVLPGESVVRAVELAAEGDPVGAVLLGGLVAGEPVGPGSGGPEVVRVLPVAAVVPVAGAAPGRVRPVVQAARSRPASPSRAPARPNRPARGRARPPAEGSWAREVGQAGQGLLLV